MLEAHSFRPYPERRFAPGNGKRAVSAQHTPRQNHLLAALPAGDYERLLPGLELVPLALGWAVYEAGRKQRYVYFPTTSIISLLNVMEDGNSVEIALTGNEGLVGIASFRGGETTPSRAWCRTRATATGSKRRC